MTDDSMLSVRGLTKVYGRVHALDELELEVAPGTSHALLGANGSGKSTALHCIVGIIEPSSGTVSIAGLPGSDPIAKSMLGFLADDAPLPLSLTGKEFLALHQALHMHSDSEWIDFLVEELGLRDALGRFLSDYSHGMRRKIQLISALGHHPDLLILDEPYRGLDPEAGFLMETITRLFTDGGGALLVSTHDLEHAERNFDAVTIVAGGTTVASGAPESIRATYGSADLRDAYLVAVGREGELRSAADRFERRWKQNLVVG